MTDIETIREALEDARQAAREGRQVLWSSRREAAQEALSRLEAVVEATRNLKKFANVQHPYGILLLEDGFRYALITLYDAEAALDQEER